jgi:hypothetical protein
MMDESNGKTYSLYPKIQDRRGGTTSGINPHLKDRKSAKNEISYEAEEVSPE